MATAAENLRTIIDGYYAQLAELSANPKPSYSVNGRSFSWESYQSQLWAWIKEAEERLSLEDETSGAERITEGFT